MKTGLTKKQKTTSIFFTDADELIEVCTHNTALKNRLAAFAEKYPAECRLIDDDENCCQTYEISKGRCQLQADAALFQGMKAGCQ